MTILTVGAYVAAYLAATGGKESVGAYLVTGYAFAMLLNVLFPHVLATVFMRRYAPGAATAVLLNLPITLLLLSQGLEEGYINLHVFAWVGPLVVIGIVAVIPALFAIGKWQPRARRSR